MTWKNVEFLEKGDRYYLAVLAAVASAQHSIFIEKYIFRYDHTGRKLLEALGAAQARGVRVVLRVDGVGSREELSSLNTFCSQAKIELEVFHPLPFAAASYRASGPAKFDTFLTRWQTINRRSHRKLVIIDEQIAFAGGRNIDDVESEVQSGREAWHDLSIRLEGEPVRDLVAAFWFRLYRSLPTHDFLMNYTWRQKQARNAWFWRRFQNARTRIWVVTPYFAPTPMMSYQLRRAARRGIDIRLVLPRRIDIPLSRLAARGLYRRLLRWGVKIYEYEPKILHRKLWVLDDLVLVGSGNFNHRSFVHDLELDIVLQDPTCVAKGSELFRKDQAASFPVSLQDLEQLPGWKRMLYWLASWLVYWL